MKIHMLKAHDLTVYLMSFERTQYLESSINSILINKKEINFEFVISDNSKSNNVKKFIENYFSNITYVRHNYKVINSQTKHFNKILSENKSKFVMLFHDDDILINGSISYLYRFITTNKKIVCVAPNSYKIKKNKKIYSSINKLIKNEVFFTTQKKLAKRFINPFKYQVNPFSGYMYRYENIKNIIRDDREGGTWSDASFLIKLIPHGNIVWLKKPFMFYRTHNNNASSKEKIYERLSLINFLKNNKIMNKNELEIYKIYSFLRYFFLNKLKLKNKRERLLIYFLIKKIKYYPIIFFWIIKKFF